MEDILTSLDTTRQSLLPQMKILEQHHLISHFDDSYGLTKIGKLMAERILHLVETVETLDIDIDYWGTHDLGFIPSHMLKRIGEIKSSKIMVPHFTEIHDLIKDFFETSIKSKSLNVATIFYHPQFIEMFEELIKLQMNVRVIASEDMLNKSKENMGEAFKKMIESEFFHLWVCHKEMRFMSFAYNDIYVRLSPLTSTGEYDFKYVVSFDSEAVNWAKDLFEYYLKDSTLITEL